MTAVTAPPTATEIIADDVPTQDVMPCGEAVSDAAVNNAAANNAAANNAAANNAAVQDDAPDQAANIVARLEEDTVPARQASDIAAVGANAEVTLETLPGRDLDQAELLALAASIAAKPELLQQHIAFSDDKRHYVSLHRDTHVDVWLLCWTPQNDTGWHDHDISSGAVAVTQGCLTEHNLAIGTPSIETEIHAGAAYSFGPDHIHRLTGRDPGSVSVHAYSPPLWRMGQYTLGNGGVLRRKSVSYADELRPLDDMA